MAEVLENKTNNLVYFVTAHILLLIGYAFSRGLFADQTQLFILSFAWLVLLMPLLKKPWLSFNFNISPLNLLLFANLVSFILFYFFDGGIYLTSQQAYVNVNLLKFLALILFLFYFVNFNLQEKNFFSGVILHLSKNKFIYLLVLAFALRLAIVFYSPAPIIDIFYVTNGAVDSLVKKQDPYAVSYYNVYHRSNSQDNDTYSYLPATIFFNLPFRIIFGDVRFGYILAQILIVFFIYKLFKLKNIPQKIIEFCILLFLFLPISLFVLEQTWIESILMLFLYFFIWAYYFNKQTLIYFILGVILSLKQTLFPLVIFIFKVNFLKNYKKLFWTILTIAIFYLPFLFWNFNAMYHNTFIALVKYKPLSFSLSFNILYGKIFGYEAPSFLNFIFLIIFLIFLLFRVKRNLISIINAFNVFLLTAFMIHFGLPNYFFFISSCVVLLIILCLLENKEKLKI